MFLTLTIELHEIMTIVTKAYWDGFWNVENNKKSISKRGWFPFNRHLMTYPFLELQ